MLIKYAFIHQDLVVRRPISANSRLHFNLGFFLFLYSKAFFEIIFYIAFRASNYYILDENNSTKFPVKISLTF